MAATEDDLTDRLAANAPQPVANSTLDHLGHLVRVEAARSRRRRVRAGLASAAVGVALGVFAAPAAADAIRDFLAQTDWLPDAGAPSIPGSDFVDLGAPDLAHYVDSIYPEWLPLAPGYSRAAVVEQTAADYSHGDVMGQTFTQEITLRRHMEHLAYCGWIDTWNTSTDDTLRRQAASVMLERSTWPATVALADTGTLELFDAIGTAAVEGDRDGVLAAAQVMECSSWDGVDRSEWIANSGFTR